MLIGIVTDTFSVGSFAIFPSNTCCGMVFVMYNPVQRGFTAGKQFIKVVQYKLIGRPAPIRRTAHGVREGLAGDLAAHTLRQDRGKVRHPGLAVRVKVPIN